MVAGVDKYLFIVLYGFMVLNIFELTTLEKYREYE